MDELSRFACEADVATVITASIAELEKTTWPGLAQLVRNRLQAGDCDNEVPANCSQCEELLRGLHRAPGFAVSYPNKHTKACRDYVDRLVRQTFNNKSQISAMGYIMGRRRWKDVELKLAAQQQREDASANGMTLTRGEGIDAELSRQQSRLLRQAETGMGSGPHNVQGYDKCLARAEG